MLTGHSLRQACRQRAGVLAGRQRTRNGPFPPQYPRPSRICIAEGHTWTERTIQADSMRGMWAIDMTRDGQRLIAAADGDTNSVPTVSNDGEAMAAKEKGEGPRRRQRICHPGCRNRLPFSESHWADLGSGRMQGGLVCTPTCTRRSEPRDPLCNMAASLPVAMLQEAPHGRR